MVDPNIITLITSLTALSASILGPMVTLRTARVQFNAAVLSNNRQKWIDALRDLIATFQSQIIGASIAKETLISADWKIAASDPAILARAEQMVLTVSKIRLMINPAEADHSALIELMDRGIDLVRGTASEIDGEVEAINTAVTAASQSILKREWSRVKRGR